MDQIGGLVGYNMVGDGISCPTSIRQVTDSYATGAVRGDNLAGGLIGFNEGTLLQMLFHRRRDRSGTGSVSGVERNITPPAGLWR